MFGGVNPKYWIAAKFAGTFFKIWPLKNNHNLLKLRIIISCLSGRANATILGGLYYVSGDAEHLIIFSSSNRRQ